MGAGHLKSFKFVGPIIPTRVSIVAPKERALKINGPEDLAALRIGTILDDIGEQLVLDLGVPDTALSRNKSAVNLVRMLDRDRLDVIAYAEDIARYQFIAAGVDPNEYESVYVLQESHMGYAFHKSTDDAVLEPLQTALDELRAEGVIDSIYNSYLDRTLGTKADSSTTSPPVATP